MKIAILGFGTVGKGVYEIINKKSTSFTSQISIKKILIRETRLDYYKKLISDPLYNSLPKDVLTSNISDISNDNEIALVVECMGGVNPSYEYVIECLKNNKKVVTSNKMLLAEKYLELIPYKNQLKYEACVGGGIHIFHSINNIKKVDKIKSFTGIINGTTNFILSKMTENNNLEFSQVLKEAQNLGYAEADPSSDIDGVDASYKAVLLYNEIFENKINVKKVQIKGIRDIKKEDIIKAKEEKKIIKLIAYGDEKEIYVKPMLIDESNYLAHVNQNLNCIVIDSENLGVSSYVGQGAGKFATAHAVVLDICDFLK